MGAILFLSKLFPNKGHMILITGASDNHAKSLDNFITSFIRYNEGRHHLSVWNLGMTDWVNRPHPAISYKVFDYSKYPEWFDITKNAGEYAWKPAIVYDVAQTFPGETVVWMDAGNLLTDSLRNLERFLRTNAMYSSYSVGRIMDWTHPKTIEALGCTWPTKLNRNGACIGFNTSKESARVCLKAWYDAALVKEVIAPEGSNRSNHRQDQSVFSILYYKYVGSDVICNSFLGYTIHNDV